MKPKVALAWAVTAANTLDNRHGFSPAQLVFGRNPSYPSLLSAGPSGLEDVEVSVAVASHIHAMHLAREAFVQCESDRVLAEALRKRLYVGGGQGFPGMWVYYKQGRKWQGPIKIHSIDGKKLYSVRAGRLITVNRDDVILAKAEESIEELEPLLQIPTPRGVKIPAL